MDKKVLEEIFMQFRFFMPTKVFFGSGCIAKNQAEFSCWGKRALLVTGRNSARVSGALGDVCSALEKQGISWEIFDQIGENPTFAMVEAGGMAARQWKPDMIIAIGGGSPLDAAKAVAVLAVNDITAVKLYDGNFATAPLPILAIPITAGTGSEVTPYSILTDSQRQTKRSFSQPELFPRVAFLDARYTQSLSPSVTVDTAVDALSHCIEGYLSRRSTLTGDTLAMEGIRSFGAVRQALVSGNVAMEAREMLLYVSLLGGMVIAQSGTTVVHALGYSLTYFHNVPHGRANGLLLGEYLRFNQPVANEKVINVLCAMGMRTVDEFTKFMDSLFPEKVALTELELDEFAGIAIKTANIANTPRQANEEELKQILRRSLSTR